MDFNTSDRIDLHIHSTASDGSLTPEQIVQKAESQNLRAISITDHDTISGCKAALSLQSSVSVKILTGIEISANPPEAIPLQGSFHILGYCFDPENPDFNCALKTLQNARNDRNPKMIDKLNQLGFSLTVNEIKAQIGDSQMGRPHIAEIMVKKGYVSSIDEAFDFYLGKGKPAYVDKFRIKAEDAIALIRSAGGVPVLAHPGLISLKGNNTIETLIALLASFGLMGIEAYYPEHQPEQISTYQRIADKYQLLLTGGSDFHGNIKPNTIIGCGSGNLFVPGHLVPTLEFAARSGFQHIFTLQSRLGYFFSDPFLLSEALNHRSYVNEVGADSIYDNERLEFLGDAVIDLVISRLLMEAFPDTKEGDLSKMRASLVNESQLAIFAKTLNLGAHVRLGRGERLNGGHEKPSIIADTVEAVVAAAYLDGGLAAAEQILNAHFSRLISAIEDPSSTMDYKSQLQELVQVKFKTMPAYELISETGPDHNKFFELQLTVIEIQTRGFGRSKKKAEQDAARKALLILNKKRGI